MPSQPMIFNLLKLLFDNQIKSISEDIEKMHASEKTHMPNFLSHELGTKTIAQNTSATNGFPGHIMVCWWTHIQDDHFTKQ
jgi:hypothetical protein